MERRDTPTPPNPHKSSYSPPQYDDFRAHAAGTDGEVASSAQKSSSSAREYDNFCGAEA